MSVAVHLAHPIALCQGSYDALEPGDHKGRPYISRITWSLTK